MCTKVKFYTYEEAKAAFKKITAMQARGKKSHMKKIESFYLCEKCEAYHLTSMPLVVYMQRQALKQSA